VSTNAFGKRVVPDVGGLRLLLRAGPPVACSGSIAKAWRPLLARRRSGEHVLADVMVRQHRARPKQRTGEITALYLGAHKSHPNGSLAFVGLLFDGHLALGDHEATKYCAAKVER
jgi:hypothetical protein